jgi:hypothetical protein
MLDCGFAVRLRASRLRRDKVALIVLMVSFSLVFSASILTVRGLWRCLLAGCRVGKTRGVWRQGGSAQARLAQVHSERPQVNRFSVIEAQRKGV